MVKKKFKISFLILYFFIFGCSANNFQIDPIPHNFEDLTFNVVQKKLVTETELPDHIENLITQWFDQRVKINGFDGDMIFKISEYNEEVSIISEGKRIEVSLTFEVLLNKPSLSQIDQFKGKVNSYGELIGNFSLSEFDIVIQNTQTDLIMRLSQDLKSKL